MKHCPFCSFVRCKCSHCISCHKKEATCECYDQERDLNPLEYADNPAELELQKELSRTGIRNEPCPFYCDDCGIELEGSSGFADETILFCPTHGPKWADMEGAIRNVY